MQVFLTPAEIPVQLVARVAAHFGIEPRLAAFVVHAWAEALLNGRRFRVLEGRRSGERQDQLYEQGRTTPGPVVTWTRDSEHEKGSAVDLDASSDFLLWLARNVAPRHGIKWGGDWSAGKKDPPHFSTTGR